MARSEKILLICSWGSEEGGSKSNGREGEGWHEWEITRWPEKEGLETGQLITRTQMARTQRTGRNQRKPHRWTTSQLKDEQLGRWKRKKHRARGKIAGEESAGLWAAERRIHPSEIVLNKTNYTWPYCERTNAFAHSCEKREHHGGQDMVWWPEVWPSLLILSITPGERRWIKTKGRGKQRGLSELPTERLCLPSVSVTGLFQYPTRMLIVKGSEVRGALWNLLLWRVDHSFSFFFFHQNCLKQKILQDYVFISTLFFPGGDAQNEVRTQLIKLPFNPTNYRGAAARELEYNPPCRLTCTYVRYM